MLERMRSDDVQFGPATGVDAAADRLNLDHLFAAIRRQTAVVAITIAVMLALGIVYIVRATPYYTASVQLLIDVNNVQIVDKLTETGTNQLGDGVVTSQIELMSSENITGRVVDKLDLTNNAQFMTKDPGILDIVIGGPVRFLASFMQPAAGPAKAPDPAAILARKRQNAMSILVSNFTALRVGETYSIKLSYADPDPKLAATIAQAFADAYLVDQLESKYDAQRRASEWMESRIGELRQKSLNSDLAVQEFRRTHNLLVAGGSLLSDAQLADVNTQLSGAQADSARTKAKYDQINAMIQSGNVDAVVSDSLTSNIINQLRTKYLEAARLRSEILPRLGEKHEQIVRLTNEMNEYKSLIFGELSRIGESYRNDYEIAKQKEAELSQRLAAVSGTSSDANATQVQLRELEREADSYRTLYQTFLQQLQQSRQQQSFPINEARIITNATVPQSPSSPKALLTIILCILLGGLLGGCIGAYREFRDIFFRTADQIREELGLPFLGYLPFIKSRKEKPRELRRPGIITKTSVVQDYAVRHPFSAAAETLRNVKITVDHSTGAIARGPDRPIRIGIVSVLPQEGKSTLSINLAEMLAVDGNPTLLIDCDLRNPSLTKTMARNATLGLQDCVMDGVPVAEAVVRNPTTGLMLLPSGRRKGAALGAPGPVRNTSDFFASPGMADTLLQAGSCKYIVMDLPPMAALIDARIIAAYVDAFILVIEWGKTARRSVLTTLANEPKIAEKCVGVVLNRANMKKMKQYQAYGSVEFYHKRISSYYETERA
jgi:succinoglycan biosynthesis transport protein ExoP